MGQKDLSERKIFEFNDVFANAVNGLLFSGEEVVKEDELEDIPSKSNLKKYNGKLTFQERDVSKLWKKGRVVISLFGLENQTGIDKNMIFRILSYDGSSYKSQLSKIESLERRLSRLKNKIDEKSMRAAARLEKELEALPDIYPVVTIVLYYGKEEWKSPLSLRHRLNVPDELNNIVSDYTVNVYNIGTLPDEEISRLKGDFKIMVDFLKNGDTLEVKEESIAHVSEMLDFFGAFIGDERFEELQKDIVSSYKERNGYSMCDIKAVLDKIENRGREQGLEQGRLDAFSLTIRNLMSNLKLSLEQALDAVGISEDEKPKYRKIVQAKE